MPQDSALSRRAALTAMLAMAAVPAAFAQAGKPVKIVLSVSPGSGIDVLTRTASRSLEAALAHPVVIENVPGAGGLIGTQALMKSPPDGYTVSVISPNHVIAPVVLKNASFHPVNDFTAIAVVGGGTMVLAVNPKVSAKSLTELVAQLRTNPDSLTYGSAGNGSFLHLAAAAFFDAAGVKARHIPYKGGNQMATDLMSGQIDMAIMGVPQVTGAVKGGTLRPLAVLSAKRAPLLPDVQTATEQGVRFIMDGWFAVIGPKGMAAEDVKRINGAFEKAFSSQEVKEAMATQGAFVEVSTPEKARAFLQTESARFADVVKKSGVVVE